MYCNQEAEAATRGFKLDSGSFNAIEENSLNTASKQSQNTKVENEMQDTAFDFERDNVANSLNAQLFGNIDRAMSNGERDYNDAARRL